MEHIIYQHINKINNKRYIGQTNGTLERRSRNGFGYQDCPRFWNAIQKYGWDNFSHEIIEVVNSSELANEREKYWIAYYDTYNNEEKGYNMTPGGENYMTELWQNPEYREKMKKSFSESRKKLWSDKKLSEPILNKMLEGLNKAWSDEEWKKERISNMKGSKNSNSKSVINLDTGIIFSTIKEAAEWCNVKQQGGIGECCIGKRKTYGKHPIENYPLHWSFLEDKEKKTIEEIEKDRNKHKERIKVICLNNNMVFNNLSIAAEWSGLKKPTSISRCCRKMQKTAGKHPETGEPLRWKYLEEGGKE